MLFNSDSPFRHLPEGLDKKQLKLFGGIRYSLEMYHLAFVSLNSTLLTISNSQETRSDQDTEFYTIALIWAWSLVDSANRLAILLKSTPGLKQKDPIFQINLRKLQQAEDLRNAIQHLNGTIIGESKKDTEYTEPVWGSLSWIKTETLDPFKGKIFILVPGALETTRRYIPNPAGKALIRDQAINLVELTAYRNTLSLSDLHMAVISLAEYLNIALREKFSTDVAMKRTLASDMLIKLEFHTSPSENK